MELVLEPAVLLRRYRRFLADVRLPDGSERTVHVPNTGSMATLLRPECPAWIRRAANPARKLSHTLVLLEVPDGGVAVVDTSLPNHLAEEAIVRGDLPALAGYAQLRREVPYGSRNSRIDLHLGGHPHHPLTWVEVKNVTMLGSPGQADFPDSVSERGQKHLHELADVARSGERAVQLYVVNRTDCHRAGIAAAIDPAYARAAQQAVAAGVEFLAARLRMSQQGGTCILRLEPCAVDLAK